MAPRNIVLAFDLYGTLLSTSSISTTLSSSLSVPSEKGDAIASRWRILQLEYSWRMTCMGKYVSFRDLTRASLLHSLSEEGVLSPSDETVDRLMGCYDGLPAFPDATKGLQVLAAEKAKSLGHRGGSLKAVVFSNGVETTVRDALVKADLEGSSGTGKLFDGVVSAQPTEAFKPSSKVYQHLVDSVGSSGKDGEVWLVSSNPFDVTGALGCGVPGLKAVWVDRAGTGWIDKLGSVIGVEKPTLVVGGVDEAVKQILDDNS
ncbi:haloacid dehalogenase [Zalerion maritima]|uniref:Haloacid dehalogenase n=1 Tax=Zalerion maritima TaxID=339359 RepID=A0AAD5WV03_9PEZI|nr:haloacid dehalogenase [Zalerion maritima]